MSAACGAQKRALDPLELILGDREAESSLQPRMFLGNVLMAL